MKITYRLKYAVLNARRDGYQAVTTKAYDGTTRIVLIDEILRHKPHETVGQDSKYAIIYQQIPIKAISFKELMRKYNK